MFSQRFVLITGAPGVGKTTLIKTLAKDLDQTAEGLEVSGFYTSEVRDDHRKRIGYDAVAIDGAKELVCPLARIETDGKAKAKTPKVGQYSVFVPDFEQFLDEAVSLHANCLILDEIGKMELLSTQFEHMVTDLMRKRHPRIIIATIPLSGSLPIVQKLRKLDQSKQFTVTKGNRNTIYAEILELVREQIVNK